MNWTLQGLTVRIQHPTLTTSAFILNNRAVKAKTTVHGDGNPIGRALCAWRPFPTVGSAKNTLSLQAWYGDGLLLTSAREGSIAHGTRLFAYGSRLLQGEVAPKCPVSPGRSPWRHGRNILFRTWMEITLLQLFFFYFIFKKKRVIKCQII